MIPQSSPVPGFSPISVSAPHARFENAASFKCLRGVDLFSHWQDTDLLPLASAACERRVDKGGVVFRQDESGGGHLFVVLEGEAAVFREDAAGRESLLAILRAGDTCGETELFDPGAHGATVRAVVPTRLLALRRDDVLRSLREKPERALGFLAEIARRLHLSYRALSGIRHQKVPRRVASVLFSLMEERGMRLKDTEGRRCLFLGPRPTQRSLADLAGTSRETVSRLFARWEDEGLLSDRPEGLMVHDEARLRRLAGEE